VSKKRAVRGVDERNKGRARIAGEPRPQKARMKIERLEGTKCEKNSRLGKTPGKPWTAFDRKKQGK